MVCFLGHCEIIVLEGRQGLVTPQLVILRCSLILERSVFQKCSSATIGPIFKYFLLHPSFNQEEFGEKKKKSLLFTPNVLLHLYSISSSYIHHFPFIRSCNQNPRLRKSAVHSCFTSPDLPLLPAKSPVPVFLRGSTAAWLGKLMLMLQRVCHKPRANAPSHISAAAQEPKMSQFSLNLGEVQMDLFPLQLACLERALWGVSFDPGTPVDTSFPKVFCCSVIQ